VHFSLAEKCLNPQFVNFGRLAAFSSFFYFRNPESGRACINSAAACFGGCGLYPLLLLGLVVVHIDFCIFALF
jgi:hypothetical protein